MKIPGNILSFNAWKHLSHSLPCVLFMLHTKFIALSKLMFWFLFPTLFYKICIFLYNLHGTYKEAGLYGSIVSIK